MNNTLEQAEDEDGTPVAPSMLKVFAAKLESYYKDYTALHREVLAATALEDLNVQDIELDAFELLHTDTLDRLERLTAALTKPASAPNTAESRVVIHQQLRAPIPSFDGKVDNWPKFRTMFEDIVGKSSASDAMKLSHLDDALIDEAKGWITAKMIKDNNFEQTWSQLCEQFENPRVIVDTHLEGLLNLPSVLKRTHKDLLELLKSVKRHVGGLEFQGLKVDKLSGLMLTKIITSRLDDQTLQLWERAQAHAQLPEFEATLDFLKAECQILERFQSRNQSKEAKRVARSVGKSMGKYCNLKCYSGRSGVLSHNLFHFIFHFLYLEVDKSPLELCLETPRTLSQRGTKPPRLIASTSTQTQMIQDEFLNTNIK